MNHLLHPEQHARLMEAAYQRAHRLRREAVSAFWADAALRAARALRAGWRRLAAPRAQAAPHRVQGG